MPYILVCIKNKMVGTRGTWRCMYETLPRNIMGRHIFRMYWRKWGGWYVSGLHRNRIRDGFKCIVTECVRTQKKPSAFIKKKKENSYSVPSVWYFIP